MSKYNTGNPIGSADPRDLSDNAKNLDGALNSGELIWTDRLGRTRKTLAGVLSKIGYEAPIAYAGGISFTTSDTTKTVEHSGVVYAPYPSSLPFTSDGTFSADEDKFYPVQGLVQGDAVIPVTSRAAMKAYDVPPDTQFSLEEGGRSGIFVVKSGTPPSDPQEGIYVVMDNGNYAERLYSGSVNVLWFGAVGDYDGITGTDNTTAIQAALDASGLVKQTGSGIQTIGSQNRVIIPEGTYLTETLYIDKFYVELEGVGFASLNAKSTVPNTSFIIEVGTDTRTASARADGCKIRNLRFGRENSNPFQATYDSSTFGTGATYQFQQSCGGIKVNRAHAMSVIEDCTFVGLRLGILLVGAYLFNIRNCHFSYNDRHIQGVQDTVNNISNNDQVIDGCIFGASIMNGGVWLSGFDGLRISHFDFENSHQLPFYFYQCRGLYMEHLYFENNNKYYNDSSAPAYVYNSTPFFTDVNDAVPQVYAGYDMSSFGGQVFVARNYLSSNATVSLRGAFLSISAQITPRFEDVKLTQPIGSGEYYFQDYSTGDTGFDLTNVQTLYPQKLLANDTPAIVKGNRKGGDETLNIPTTWYVDLTAGDDDINITDMSTSNRLASVNLRAIPEDDAQVYTVYVTGTGPTVILPRVHPNAKVRVIGESSPSIGSLQPMPGANFELSACTMTVLKPWDTEGTPSGIRGPMRINGRLASVTSVFDDAAGFLQQMTDCEFYLDGVDITNNNAVGYTSIVSDGTEVWLKDCTVNKQMEARNFGKIYYFNLTGPVPIVTSGRAGKVEAL